ncbi:MAG: hypothetical protein J6U43_06525, partial [Bacteroidales bacterium]|nr:hypothetical protein [Bacteroidales bacterium]
MKRLVRLFSILTFVLLAMLQVQAAQVLNYQGVLKNPNGTVRPDAQVVLTLEFVQEGVVVYSEEHRVTTNGNGYFSLHPGAGSVLVGDFDAIAWGDGAIVMRSILDGEAIAETQLTAVPYAMYAEHVAGWDMVWNSIDSIGEAHTQTSLLLDDAVLTIEQLSLADDTLRQRIDTLQGYVDAQVNDIKQTEAEMVKGANFFNATLYAPRQDGGYHSLQSAIASAPEHLRRSGTVVTFRCDSINWRSVQYVGRDTVAWADEKAWSNYGSYGNLIIPYLDNDSITRSSIPEYMRRQGLIITFVKNGRIVNEQYIESNLDNQQWCNTESWVSLSAMENEIDNMRSMVDSISDLVQKMDKGLRELSNAGSWFFVDKMEKFSQAGALNLQGEAVPNYDMVCTSFIPIQEEWVVKTFGNGTYPGISFYRDKDLLTRVPSKLDALEGDEWQYQEFDFMIDAIPYGAQYFTVNMVLPKKAETMLSMRQNIDNVIEITVPYTYKKEESVFSYVGAYVNISGKRTINGNYKHSRFLPIKDMHYKVNATGRYEQGCVVPLVVYYADISFSSMVGYDLGVVQADRSTRGEIIISPETAPEGAAYFVVNSCPSQGDSFVLSGESTADLLNDVRDRVGGLEETKSCISERKLVTLGDSFTSNSGNKGVFWQQLLVDWLSVVWSREETLTGLNGYAPMAVGGAWVMPNDANSLSLRCMDVRRYVPQIVIMYGGQNDKTNYYKLGSIEDEPFKPEQFI